MTDQTSPKSTRLPNPFIGDSDVCAFIRDALGSLARTGMLSMGLDPRATVAVLDASYRMLAGSALEHAESEVTAQEAVAWELANVLRDYNGVAGSLGIAPYEVNDECTCPDPHQRQAAVINSFLSAALAGDNDAALTTYREWSAKGDPENAYEQAMLVISGLRPGTPEFQVTHGRELLLNVGMHLTAELVRWNHASREAREDQQAEQDAANADMRQQNGDPE